MLTESNSNFRFNNSFRLFSTGAQGSPCSANLSSYIPTSHSHYMYLDAVVKMELVNIPWIHPFFPLISCIYSCLFCLKCHPSMSLSHSFFSSQQKCCHFSVNHFVSPQFSLKTDIFFYPLNSINSFHLSDVIDNNSPLIIIVGFPFLMLLMSLCVTVVSHSLHI